MTNNANVAPVHARFNYMQVWNIRERRKLERCIPSDVMGIIMEESKSPVVLAHDDFAKALAFAPDGKSLVTTTADGYVMLWDTATWTIRRKVCIGPSNGGYCAVNGVDFSSSGSMYATADSRGWVCIWNTETGKFCGRRVVKDTLKSVAFVKNDTFVVSTSEQGWISEDGIGNVYYTADRIATTNESIISSALSADRKTIALILRDAKIRLRDVDTRLTLLEIAVMPDACHAAAFSSTVSLLAFNDYDEIDIYDLQKKAVTSRFRCDYFFKNVTTLQFSPQGLHLASGSDDSTATITDVETGKHLFRFEAHKYKVERVAYSPDGNLLATSSLDTTVRLWDARSGKPVKRW